MSGFGAVFLGLDFESDSVEVFFHDLEVLVWDLFELFVSVLWVAPVEPIEFLKAQGVEDDSAKADDFMFDGVLSTGRNDVGNEGFGILQYCGLFRGF